MIDASCFFSLVVLALASRLNDSSTDDGYASVTGVATFSLRDAAINACDASRRGPQQSGAMTTLAQPSNQIDASIHGNLISRERHEFDSVVLLPIS